MKNYTPGQKDDDDDLKNSKLVEVLDSKLRQLENRVGKLDIDNRKVFNIESNHFRNSLRTSR